MQDESLTPEFGAPDESPTAPEVQGQSVPAEAAPAAEADNEPAKAEAEVAPTEEGVVEAAPQVDSTNSAPTEAETAPKPSALERAYQAAVRFARAGCSMVRVNAANKRPFGSWKIFQTEPAPPEEIAAWPPVDKESVAVVCGPISGGTDENDKLQSLTCLDFDVPRFFDAFCASVGELIAGLVIQRTGSGGFQIFFRSSLIVRNEKLAHAPNDQEEVGWEVAIETRGEGGYAIVAPSIHPSGNPYVWLQGDLESAPVITEAQAEALLDAARALDEVPDAHKGAKGKKRAGDTKASDKTGANDDAKEAKDKSKSKASGPTPPPDTVIGAFNQTYSIEEMLERFGYTRVDAQRFARPGGTNPSVEITENGRSFHYNSNDPLYDQEHTQSPFDVYRYYAHGDSIREAVKAAAEELGLPARKSSKTSATREQKRAWREETLSEFEQMARERGVPLIETLGRQLKDKLFDLGRAIASANASLPSPQYFHGPRGLSVITRNQAGAAFIARVSRARMQVIASTVAFFTRTAKDGGGSETDPPRELCENFLEYDEGWSDAPRLNRVAEAPFFAADGSLCDKTGYYESAHTWLELPESFDIGDTTPTEANVAAAKALIFDTILGEVEFEDDSSRAHAASLMILPFVRAMIQGPTPLHLVQAPVVSSGKSYLVGLCLSPFTTPVPTSEKGNMEEWRKSLLAKLVTGAPAIWLDNIKKNLDSPTLDMAITSPTGYMEDRLTGTGENVTAPVWCVWVATGNNATLTEDAASRAIVINIVPSTEDPSQRRYKGDPARFIRENRGQVCGAIITLVRAWQVAGCPDYQGPFTTRFAEWTRIIGGILETVGVEGFLENVEKQRRLLTDESVEAWAEFVVRWDKEFGDEPKSAAALMPLAQEVPWLDAELSGSEGASKARSWAQKLVKQRNRIHAGYKIVDGPKVARLTTYRLVPLPLTPPSRGN